MIGLGTALQLFIYHHYRFSWATCLEGTALKRGWDHWRQVVHDVVDNPFFEWTILLLIFASRYRHRERER